jgi:ribosomal protein S18 acetylase RimI-like enzyme
MLVDLDVLDEEPLPSGIHIVEVAGESSFHTFSRVLSEGFELPAFDEFAQMFIDAGTGGNGSIASFLGMLDGEPVATSRAILDNDLAGIYTVATLPQARGKGFGRAMTLAACLYGKERGYHLGTLQASAMGHPVYLRMGFRDVCEFRDYTWAG